MESLSESLTHPVSGSLHLLLGGAIVLVVLYIVARAIYNVFFHPLSKYPGPTYAIISGLSWQVIILTGDTARWHQKQHEKYGEIVRVGPDRLSYITPQAWKDIYGHRTRGRLENPKDMKFYNREYNGEDILITMQSPATHGQQRKIFSNAFSDKALKLQEPLITKYVDQLIGLIRRSIKDTTNSEMDMVKLLNCCTFDIMGDLTFGEPLGMLQNSEYTPWVKSVFQSLKAGAFLHLPNEYPALKFLVAFLTPKWMKETRKKHFEHSADRVDLRLAKGDITEKPDIWSLVLEKGRTLTIGQMHANASLFMLAGTETTATLLSGLTYQFLKSPDKLQKAVDEVRALPEDGLTLEQLPRLRYLNACFEEAFRMYPPVPIGLPRTVPQGGSVICGDWLPEGTRILVPQWAAYMSTLNFKDPQAFVPERWLPDTGYESDRKDVLMPFMTGPRNCLGKNLAYHEMRIIMAKVLWHFDLELCSQSDKWAEQKVYDLWQKPPLWCRAKDVR